MTVSLPFRPRRAPVAAEDVDGPSASGPAAPALGRGRAGDPDRRQMPRRLSASLRRAFLLVHIVAGVGWLGIAAVTFVLALATVAETDPAVLTAAYRFHELLIGALARPAALLTLGTGLVLAVGTKWGIAKYHWPLVKLVLTVATIAITANLTPGWIATALAGVDTPLDGELVAAHHRLIGMAAFHILIIGAATWLSVYKPGGRTPWSRRRPPSTG